MPLKDAFESVGQIADEMKPVGDLRGVRGTLRRPFGVTAGAVPTDDLDARMLLKPRG